MFDVVRRRLRVCSMLLYLLVCFFLCFRRGRPRTFVRAPLYFVYLLFHLLGSIGTACALSAISFFIFSARCAILSLASSFLRCVTDLLDLAVKSEAMHHSIDQ